MASDAKSVEVAGAWSSGFVDGSKVTTYVVSILLIIYGSFRSINIEQEKQQEKKDRLANGDSIQTLDSCQAAFLPIGASISLLIIFLFFDSLQIIFAICTAVLATVAFAFLLLPFSQFLIRPCSSNPRISCGFCGRFTVAEVLSFFMASFLVCMWVLTGHWLLMDALGMGICVAFIALIRLPSLKVSLLLLCGLLVYDVFWVFFSQYIFNTNVMVRVATRPADNPLGVLAKKLNIDGLLKETPKLSLPGKLVFPSSHSQNQYSMLGLGDIVMPGLLLCFVLRYDAYKRTQMLQLADSAGPTAPPLNPLYHRITYFHCSLIGYFVGLITATVSSEYFQAAQPALLYLVPFTVLPLLTMAYLRGDLWRMWSEPFGLGVGNGVGAGGAPDGGCSAAAAAATYGCCWPPAASLSGLLRPRCGRPAHFAPPALSSHHTAPQLSAPLPGTLKADVHKTDPAGRGGLLIV